MDPVLLRIRGARTVVRELSSDLWMMARLWIIVGETWNDGALSGLRSLGTG